MSRDEFGIEFGADPMAWLQVRRSTAKVRALRVLDLMEASGRDVESLIAAARNGERKFGEEAPRQNEGDER